MKIKVEYINPFIQASRSVIKNIANVDISLGKAYLKTWTFPLDSFLVSIDIMGNLKGQVIFSMEEDIACNVASNMMMGIPVKELDDMSKSAVSEAVNMIMGNAATLLYDNGFNVNITPPSFELEDNIQKSLMKSNTICVPLKLSSGGTIELDLALAQ